MEEVKGNKGKGVRRSRAKSTGGMTAAAERKEIERERRQHMKGLCLKLASLIPKENYSSTDTMTQLDSLDEAASYIKKLKDRVDELQQQKSSAQAIASLRSGVGQSSKMGVFSELEVEKAGERLSASVPVVQVRHHDDSSMDVVLLCSAKRPIKFHEVITILEEEGAEVVNANYSISGDKVFYTIHCRAFSSRIGIEVSRVSERLSILMKFVN